ncbi:hypothetical protein EU527_15815 [Candidatus Thorarchaeota archaeon]|nr:MAG: hypothetical protein EU527_15815 [Candidatus Thorarchaeota archaeon]
MNDKELKVNLVDIRGPTSVHIDAEIDAEGSLIISGQDIGEIPLEHFGDADYEYWVVVPENQKNRLLLVLLKSIYSENTKLVTSFINLLKTHNIQYEFGSYT